MMQKIKEIKPGIGLGVLKFGMTKEEVKEILGKPEEIEAYNDSESIENLTETWHYDEMEMSLNFDQQEDWKLVTVSVTSEFFVLKEQTMIGLKKDVLIETLAEFEIDDLVVEDMSTKENPNQELIISDAKSLGFWLEKDVLTEIQWEPIIDDDDNIVWPE